MHARPTTPSRDRAGRSQHSPFTSHSTRRWARFLLWTFAVVVGLLLLAQLIASPIATRLINSKLQKMEGFTGRVEGVNVALWRGGAQVKNFILHERGKENENPVVKVDKAAGKIALPHLLGGKLLGELTVDRAEFTTTKLFDAPKESPEKAEQKKEEIKEQIKTWQETLAKAFPMKLTKLEVKNSSVRFIDKSHSPVIDVALHDLHILGSGFGNQPQGDPLPAKVTLQAVTTGQGKLRIETQADPLSKTPRFVTKFELREQQLSPINAILQAYAGMDVGTGVFELFTEIKADNGSYSGYSKPFLKDLDFRTSDDKNKKLGQKIKESAADVVTTVLKNRNEDKVATEAPIFGNFANNNVDVWTTVDNLLRNAFVEALRAGFGRETKMRVGR